MSEKITSEKVAAVNAVSPCFCVAKWKQVTIDLVHGTNHSCHHPKRHSIPLDELRANHSALHNTFHKKEQRRMMLEGTRPKECGYCWDIEDSGMIYSDRIIKSTDPWAFEEIDKIKNTSWDANVQPTYLEIMIDDLCNFSCMYCISDVSTSVSHEMKTHGPYDVKNHAHRMPNNPRPEGENPYLRAFWRWLPDLWSELKVLRVTGGEPLLSRHLGSLLDFIESRKKTDLTLVINSHLGHNDERLEKLTERIRRMLQNSNIKAFELYTSADTFGQRAEYIRYGMNYQRFLKNLEFMAKALPECPVVVMCTFSSLSIAGFNEFLENITQIKKNYTNVKLDISYLRFPEYLRANIVTDDLKKKIADSLDFMSSKNFSRHEVLKMENVVAWVKKGDDQTEIGANRRDFFSFINEYDRRKKKVFLEVYPEYKNFYLECKKAAFDLLFQKVGQFTLNL